MNVDALDIDAMNVDVVNANGVNSDVVKADVVIIGGGIAGLSLAWALAPTRTVVLVEAEPALAFHTSARSARQMQPHYGPAVIQELTRRSIAMVEDISATLAAPILIPRPLITLGNHAEVAELLAGQPGLKLLGHTQAMALSPDLRPDTFFAAALDDSAKEVDVPALLEYYRRQGLAAGATVLLSAPVTTVHHDDTGFTLTAGEHEIKASVVVNAAGAWAQEVATLCGVPSQSLIPYRRSVAIVSTARPVNPAGPMVEPFDESYYFRPDGGNLLISPCESVPAPAGDAQVVDADIRALIERIDAVTTLGITGVVRAWTGLRTEAPDGIPVVGFDAAVPNFFWLAGQGGYGIQTSAALATLAAAMITGTLPAADQELAGELSPQRAGVL
ncbi:NAD(P)/FAD-dependent oxidoreductase [Arthrobacter psychrochitiniphilus]|uniref:NAD(P)/FAD-dependent oxidoreductase n=1 Tax=Arthrobacter psychrochitiniphilus TaxID=291045 RepID=UPI003F7BA7FA